MLKPWFLQPKPKIILPDQAPDDSGFGRGLLPDDVLSDLPWVSEFDLFDPVDQRRLRQVLRASTVKGQTFIVRSATDAQGEALATFSDFPTGDAVGAAVAEPYGRGPYGVWSTRPRPQLIRTYFVHGSARRPSARSRQQRDRIADIATELKADLMEMAIEHLREHPEVLNELALGLLCKEIGVQIPKMPSFEEEIVREARRDPAFREEEVERIMESRKAEAERVAETERLDYLLSYLKKINIMARMMGHERNAKPSGGAGLDELMKIVLADGSLRDIVEAFKNVRQPRNDSQGLQASP